MYPQNRPGQPQECRFVKSDGRRCHAMAVRGMAYCRHHLPAHRRPTAKGRSSKPIRIEFALDDASQSRAKAIDQLNAAMAEGKLDHRTGDLCICGVNLLTSSTATRSPKMAPAR